MEINRNLLVQIRQRLQTTRDPPTGNKSSLYDSESRWVLLTGLPLLASTPCNWHPHWFYNRANPSLTTLVTTSLTGTPDDGTSHNPTSERTQLFTPPFNEDDTSSVFLLQFTNSDMKLLTSDECSSRNTGCIPPSETEKTLFSFL